MKRSKRLHRLFAPQDCINGKLVLDPQQAHYLSHVLRLRKGAEIIAFNGRGQEWRATVGSLARRHAELETIEPATPLPESTLELVLVQALVKSDAMDRIVQKATELGVRKIVPVNADHSVVNVDGDRAAKRRAHWQRIAQSACEQCGRHRIPDIAEPVNLSDAVAELNRLDLVLALDPCSDDGIGSLPDDVASVAAIVGPEGGFGPSDLRALEAFDVKRIRLGRRVLRADTAAIAVCSFAQCLWGDLS